MEESTKQTGGARIGAGRKPKPGRRHTVRLLDEHTEWLRRLGDGDLSDGIAEATRRLQAVAGLPDKR